ncbi:MULTISPECIES: bifunctional UDP-N-acetylglucosamine diphosphorylase/glucosamine-1-phosphate N-acetyltransferase GlmU [Pseudomonas]|uniref:Bifunctional protein GlmU n=1 Tax=Pseudomonas quercus TaxID=2722792 RepID=A0ABX0YLB4_9PSED|nr:MULTISPECIES: bifunctional UDP-N-acetylglucosamine diphosphorylase/glucosamine-1-phosphate N-acetyltransferase GlmU [Pseudomonas]MBF7144367.1 bifunctional UDP-N-acetylglucosamine diphosphorylase/glucosamine-1-phosphate N-acetyltransferase GlmU [Pseudomonas sp. LY10J]NJP02906.1 bifunctional UDP-N-acetylglucosamine diphosphorylase/glucosamine-1-phosphate N-acetyltransferase GlmU [Pseudomonas quercus]
MSLDIVILAAGQGTRMRSALPKVLHPVAGRSMLGHVIHSARELAPVGIHVVIGHGAEQVRAALQASDIHFVVQAQQLGTGHAVAQAQPGLASSTTLVLYGDVPLIQPATLRALLAKASETQVALLTVNLADPTGYGRIIRDAQGRVTAIVEHKDATEAQRQVREGNTGILALPTALLAGWMARLSNNNVQGEYYLTDIIAMAVADGLEVATETAMQPMEVQGANDRRQLAELERFYQQREAERLMAVGVTLRDPARLDVRGEVIAGRDVMIDVNVLLEGRVVIEDDVQIGANVFIKDCTLKRGAIIKPFTHLEGATVGEGADAGPFARLRPGTVLEEKAHVGNFVELKNAHMGPGAKAGHLSYLGDASIGARANIGAGTITCNYDGANKHRTELGADVFIGSNNALVAPLKVGDGATTAAGSTITADIPEQQLGVARARQRNIDGWKRPEKKKP